MSPARRTLFAIVALCLLPVLIPLGLHYIDWHPASARAQGELLQPARPLPAAFADSEGRWRIAVAGHGPCDSECLAMLDVSRRIHVALYKMMPRAKRIWITDDAAASRDAKAALLAAQPDLQFGILEQDRNTLDFDQAGYRLYLIDPQGLVVMRYREHDAQALFKSAFKDLERLLRFS